MFFGLCAEGLELIEIAPGVDLQTDILDRMDFVPVMRTPPALMDSRIFREEPMKLRPQMLEMPLAERLSYNAGKNILFLNFEGLSIRSQGEIERVRQAVVERLAPLGHKVTRSSITIAFRSCPNWLTTTSTWSRD